MDAPEFGTESTSRLLDLYCRKVPDTAGRLLSRHRTRLRAFVAQRFDQRLTARADPSDVVQETMLVAHRYLDDYCRDKPLPFLSWLCRLAQRRLIELHRRQVAAVKRSVLREARPSPSQPLSEFSANTVLDPRSAASDRESLDALRAALEALSQELRQVVLLRHYAGLSVKEVAERLAIAEGTVKSRHFRALLQLKHAIAGEQD